MTPLLASVQRSSTTFIRASLQRGKHVITSSSSSIRSGDIRQSLCCSYNPSYSTQTAASTINAYNNETIPLAYEYYAPSQATSSSPLVVLHGLFGSKQNWRSLARGLAQRLSTSIYAVDLRNHGDSPHASCMDYAAMAADIERFIDEQQLERVTLVGHSMGAHVAMTLALSKQIQDRVGYLERVILVDKAPRDMALDRAFSRYVEGMQLVERAGVARQSDADRLLVPYVPDISVRQFLLTNLKRDTTGPNHKYQFRVPLDVIARRLPSLGQMQLPIDCRPFDRPTLFVAGTRSDYIRPQDHAGIYKLFPQASIEYLDTGHWGKCAYICVCMSYFLVIANTLVDLPSSSSGKTNRIHAASYEFLSIIIALLFSRNCHNPNR
ncbi:Alpha/Beta hydrolase protein [Syncephalis plumigaleata]|nr:Alpha/Beta hydrolase protein [Syncephalis plumigaleata]